MDIKKYEKLINLVVNEDIDQAHELFHEIVVEKSREIFESIMAEEMDDMEEGMGGRAGDLLDEINAEESGEGMMEDEDDIDFDDEAEDDGDELTHDLEMDHDEGDEAEEHEEIEDAVIRIEDKLDQLMAEFEDIMGGGDEDMGDEDMGDEDMGDEDMGDEEDEMDEDMMMENINLQKVPVTHGDDGAQTKSPIGKTANSGQAGMDSRPVKFAGYSETVPTSPKGPSNYGSKSEGNLPGAGNFKNVPGKNNFKDKGDATPKPVTKDGSSNDKSPVAESRRPARRPTR